MAACQSSPRSKAHGDKNLFAALVQALTYAAELVSKNQFDRLRGAYGEFAALPVERPPQCDIYIVYFHADQSRPERRSAKPIGPKLKEQAMNTADLLLRRPETTIAQRIRRIAFLRSTSKARLNSSAVTFVSTHRLNEPGQSGDDPLAVDNHCRLLPDLFGRHFSLG